MPVVGPRISIYTDKGELLARLGHRRAGLEQGQFISPHGLAVDSRGDIYVGEENVVGVELRMGDGPFRRFFSNAAGRIEFVAIAAHCVSDALSGPGPETLADQIRRRSLEKLQAAFPDVDLQGDGRRRRHRRSWRSGRR